MKLIAIGPVCDKLNSNKSPLQWETDFSNRVVNSGKKRCIDLVVLKASKQKVELGDINTQLCFVSVICYLGSGV